MLAIPTLLLVPFLILVINVMLGSFKASSYIAQVVVYFAIGSAVPKFRLLCWSIWFWVMAKDKTLQEPTDDEFNFEKAQRATVIFVRHGESEFNRVMPANSLQRVKQLFWSVLKEFLMMFNNDSVLLDAPLSQKGIEQACKLQEFLQDEKNTKWGSTSPNRPCKELDIKDIVSIIRGNAGKSVLASSILRRAISTGVISVLPRLVKGSGKEKMEVMTSLQEIAQMVDTLSATAPYAIPVVPSTEVATEGVPSCYRTCLSANGNKGNKTLSMVGEQRHLAFAKWLFEQPKNDAVIAFGHSMWFQEFFRSFLPKSSTHETKKSKLVNCGVVAFDLYKNGDALRIDEDSIKMVYGGYEGKSC